MMKSLLALAALVVFLVAAAAQTPVDPDTIFHTSNYPDGTARVGATSEDSAVLPGVAGRTTYLCGFLAHTVDAARATDGTVFVEGLLSYKFPATADPRRQTWVDCVPASAPNTAITVTSPGAVVTAWGYQR